MGREIKFRAWDKAKNMFTEWDSIGGYMLLSHDGRPTYFARTDDGVIHPPYVGELKDVIDVQMYTGLRDKNGVEIYEGDVVRKDNFYQQERPVLMTVVYEAGGFRARLKELVNKAFKHLCHNLIICLP